MLGRRIGGPPVQLRTTRVTAGIEPRICRARSDLAGGAAGEHPDPVGPASDADVRVDLRNHGCESITEGMQRADADLGIAVAADWGRETASGLAGSQRGMYASQGTRP